VSNNKNKIGFEGYGTVSFRDHCIYIMESRSKEPLQNVTFMF